MDKRIDGLAEAAAILTSLPLDYRTEDEHEALERFVESAETAILRRYVELGGRSKVLTE